PPRRVVVLLAAADLPPEGRILLLLFFQAEDGIRDRNVTGVQTCALPISLARADGPARSRCRRPRTAAPVPHAGVSARRTNPGLRGRTPGHRHSPLRSARPWPDP